MFKVEVPQTDQALPGGLLSVVDTITQDAAIAAYHNVEFESFVNGVARRVPEEGEEKTFDKADITTGKLFGLYRGFDSPLLLGVSDTPVPRTIFGLGESVAVEAAVQELLLNPNAEDLTPTPGTAVADGRVALGLLQQWYSEQFTGLPLLHANRFVTELLDLAEQEPDWKQFSKQGVPLANGAGYSATGPGGAVAPAGTGWLYISAPLHLWQGEPGVTPASDLKDNRHKILVEATYAAAIEGNTVAAILVGA